MAMIGLSLILVWIACGCLEFALDEKDWRKDFKNYAYPRGPFGFVGDLFSHVVWGPIVLAVGVYERNFRK